LIARKDFLQKISALLPVKITERFRASKLRRGRLGKKWSGTSLKRAVRISQNAATFHSVVINRQDAKIAKESPESPEIKMRILG
jgi:hypothetical protein